MKNFTKSFLVALISLLCSATANAYDFVENGIYYNILSMDDLTVEVTNGGNKYTGDVVIPSTVTYESRILSVTSIGEKAFSGCSSLTNIEIPNSVTSIGNYAFRDCSGLTSIEIPNSVTSIGEMAFSDCSGLGTICVDESNPTYDSRNNCNAIIVTKSNTLIAGCKNTVIPNSVTSIGYWAFDGCSSLTGIEIPNSVTSIGDCAFRDCSSLTSIEIPNSVTSIEGWAFRGCYSLTSIEIGNSVASIGDGAFSDCSGLGTICVDESNPTYDSRNNCNAIIETKSNTLIAGCKNTVIPNSVTSIGYWAFDGCSSLTSIEIPNSVTSIGDYAFSDCSSLTSIEIPNSVTSIGGQAFSDCSGLGTICVDESNPTYDSRNNCNAIIVTKSNILIAGCKNTVIPNSVTSIGEEAFSCCSSLTSVKIGNSVASIGEKAFYDCSNLTSIYMQGATPPSVCSDNFTNKQYQDVILYVPNGSLAAYQSTDIWKNFLEIKEYADTGEMMKK